MRFFLALIFIAFTGVAIAGPKPYAIDSANSDVGFTYVFTGNDIRGAFPDFNIDLKIDFADLDNSSVFVTLNATAATAGFVFATQAMRSAKVLNAKNFPTITFQSTTITGRGDKATINGNLTVRGITKPQTLQAQLFRPKGTAPDDLDSLIMKITGSLNRFDFGAAGYPNEVGPDLKIDITAAINAQN